MVLKNTVTVLCCMIELQCRLTQRHRSFKLSTNVSDANVTPFLANLYENKKCFIPWHSDDELSLGADPTIISLSLGGTRRFLLRNKTSRMIIEKELENGSVMVMKGKTQMKWEHCVPSAKAADVRINLTFRQIKNGLAKPL